MTPILNQLGAESCSLRAWRPHTRTMSGATTTPSTGTRSAPSVRCPDPPTPWRPAGTPRSAPAPRSAAGRVGKLTSSDQERAEEERGVDLGNHYVRNPDTQGGSMLDLACYPAAA